MKNGMSSEVDAKIKEMEKKIKSQISLGQISMGTGGDSPFSPPPKINAKNVLPIRVDESGFKYVHCPQTDFGQDPNFCIGCRKFRGESLGRIFCDHSVEVIFEEEEEL